MSALLVVVMLIVIIFGHEAAHAVVAALLGFRMNKLYLGIPLKFKIRGKEYSTTLWKKKVGSVEYGISWLIFGGAVDFDDLENAPWWKMSLIALAGPFSNVLMAFLAVSLVVGPLTAWSVTVLLSQTVLTGLGLVFSGNVPIGQLSGPVGFVSAMTGLAIGYTNGWLMVWSLINVALFITNLMPIPALDGGQVLMAIVGAVFGEKAKKPIKAITYVCLYLLCALMVFVCAKEIWAVLLATFSQVF